MPAVDCTDMDVIEDLNTGLCAINEHFVIKAKSDKFVETFV